MKQRWQAAQEILGMDSSLPIPFTRQKGRKRLLVGSFILALGLAVLGIPQLQAQSPAGSTGGRTGSQSPSLRCELTIDADGMPHIRPQAQLIQKASDLVRLSALDFCVGYLHGRFRAWQLDYLQRTAYGRRAEQEGRGLIRQDFVMRLLGLEARANELYLELPGEVKQRLTSYTDGVNSGQKEAIAAGIYEQRTRRAELLPWEPQATLALLLLQSFDQTRKTFEQVFEDHRQWERSSQDPLQGNPLQARVSAPWWTTILKPADLQSSAISTSLHSSSRQAARLSPAQTPVAVDSVKRDQKPIEGKLDFWRMFAGLSTSPVPSEGSNSWVVAPERSASGHSLLANDPHLGLKHPPFWMALHAEVGAAQGSEPLVDALGVTLPGVPIVVSGVNRHLAWGLTNSYLPASTVSWISEKELEKDSGLQKIRPMIKVRVGALHFPFFFKSFQKTSSGGLVLPESPQIPHREGYVWVLQWSGAKLRGSELAQLWSLSQSRTVAEMDERLSQVGLSSWNFVFSDSRGNIGYRAVGKILRSATGVEVESAQSKSSEQGASGGQSAALAGAQGAVVGANTLEARPVDLAGLEARWGFLSREQMPAAINPKRGFLVTANNAQWPASAKLSFTHQGHSQVESFRAHRIEELLAAKPKMSLAQMREIQCDVQAVDARYLLPELLKVLKTHDPRFNGASLEGDPRGNRVLDAMRSWLEKGTFAGGDCQACAPYRDWMNEIKARTGLSESSLWAALTASGNQEGKNSGSLGGASGPGGSSTGKLSSELLASILLGFDSALARVKLVTDGTQTRLAAWSELHRSHFEHWGGRDEFPSDPLATPGDEHTVNPGTSRRDGKYFEHWAGASHRLIVEMSSPPQVWQSLPGTLEDLDRTPSAQAAPTEGQTRREWRQWAECQLTPKVFPFDWRGKKVTQVPF
jgi:penicillin amidase